MSANPKHTPGPWHVDGQCMSSVIKCVVPRGHPDAKHTCGDYEVIADCRGDNSKANASLIAAAPDMAMEIEKQIAWLRYARAKCAGKVPGSLLNGFDQSIKYLTAALSKARGEVAV